MQYIRLGSTVGSQRGRGRGGGRGAALVAGPTASSITNLTNLKRKLPSEKASTTPCVGSQYLYEDERVGASRECDILQLLKGFIFATPQHLFSLRNENESCIKERIEAVDLEQTDVLIRLLRHTKRLPPNTSNSNDSVEEKREGGGDGGIDDTNNVKEIQLLDPDTSDDSEERSKLMNSIRNMSSRGFLTAVVLALEQRKTFARFATRAARISGVSILHNNRLQKLNLAGDDIERDFDEYRTDILLPLIEAYSDDVERLLGCNGSQPAMLCATSILSGGPGTATCGTKVTEVNRDLKQIQASIQSNSKFGTNFSSPTILSIRPGPFAPNTTH